MGPWGVVSCASNGIPPTGLCWLENARVVGRTRSELVGGGSAWYRQDGAQDKLASLFQITSYIASDGPLYFSP